MLHPGVDVQQPLVGKRGAGHRQRVRPARPHRLGGDGAGQQHAGVHRLGGRPQHGRRHGPGRDIDHARQIDPAGHAVVQAHQHIQRSGVHLHHLTWRLRVRPTERPARPVSQRPAGASRPGGVLARRQLFQQPVKTALGRQLDHARPVSVFQDLAGPPEQVGRRPRGLLLRRGDRLLHRLHHSRIHLPVRGGGLAAPVVGHPGHATSLVTASAFGDRARRHRPPRRGQLGRLGLFPAGQ